MTSRLTSICGKSISRRKVFQHLLVVGVARRPLCFSFSQLRQWSNRPLWAEPSLWQHWCGCLFVELGRRKHIEGLRVPVMKDRQALAPQDAQRLEDWWGISGQRTTILPSSMARPWWMGASLGQRSQPKEIKTTQFFTATVQTLAMASRMSLKAFGSHSSNEKRPSSTSPV